MNKSQIIAKAVLFVIGINAINYLYRYSLAISLSKIDTFLEDSFLRALLILVVCLALYIGLFILVLKKVVFYNNRFASFLSGSEDTLLAEENRLWFVTSLRIASILAGIFLLENTLRPAITTVLFCSPPNIRYFITQQMNTPGLPDFNNIDMYHLTGFVYGLIFIPLTVYLFLGAPHYIRWQLKYCSKPDIEKEIDLSDGHNE